MTTKKFISGALTFAIGLTLAGSAAAESTRGGYRDSVRIESCDDARESGSSYRDASARTGNGSGTVIVAKGSDGYRSQFAAAAEETKARQFARAMGLACSN
jgi:hypothetical protein